LFSALLSPTIEFWQTSPAMTPPLDRFAYPAVVAGEHLFLGATLLRRECLRAVGGFDPDLEPCEDSDFSLRLTMRSRLTCVDEVVVRYRRHGENTSNTRFIPSAARMYHKHLAILDDCPELPGAVRRRAAASCMLQLGDRCYALGQWRSPLAWYLRGACRNPAAALAPRFWLQTAKALLPPRLRRWLVRKLRRPSPTGT
jgi:GT2 family glycosyltransferase